MFVSERYPESPRIELSRARLPRSDSGRFNCSIANLRKNGSAASTPTDNKVTAAARRTGRLILSAINIPKPRPNAVRVSTSRLSNDSGSDVFDIEIDIAYPIRRVLEKETGNFPSDGGVIAFIARKWPTRFMR